MSKTLCPWQITGNLAKNHHDMLFKKENVAKANSSVFGEGYFDLRSPAKTFRMRNLSMGYSHTTRKEPMEVKKNLKNFNNFNYSFRRFHLQSDKPIDHLMPTSPSVANLLQNDESVQNLQSAAHLTFKKSRKSLPPPISQLQNPVEESLPQLNGTRANFASPLSKSPMRNVSIMVSRKKSTMESAKTTKTPSYMRGDRDNSRLTMNADIEFNGELPSLPNHKRDVVRIGTYATQMAKIDVNKVKMRLISLDVQHQSPREVLQRRVIERAVEKSTRALRAGTDLEWLNKLSELTSLIPRNQRLSPYAYKSNQDQVIYSPNTAAGQGSPSLRHLHERHHSEFDKEQVSRENTKGVPTTTHQPTFFNQVSNSSKFTLAKQSKTMFNLNDFVQETPKETANKEEKKSKRQRPSKHHQTVTHVPSPRISPTHTNLNTTQRDKFMDTQRIPFRNMKLGGFLDKSRVNSSEREQLSLEGSTANLNVKAPGKSSSKGFIQTGMSTSLIKFDQNVTERNPTPDEKSPKQDPEENKTRSNLKITPLRRLGSNNSVVSIISKDSQPKEDEDDYYDEVKLKSKLKPRKGAPVHQQRKNINQDLIAEAEVTQGHTSIMEKTTSTISKNIRTPKIYQNEQTVNSLASFRPNQPAEKQESQPEEQTGQSLEATKTSKVSIMNVTFNDEAAVRKSDSKGLLLKAPYGTSAFHQQSKRRFLRVKKLNEDLKDQQSNQSQSQFYLSGKIPPGAKSGNVNMIKSKPTSKAPSSQAVDKEYSSIDIAEVYPLNSFKILSPSQQQPPPKKDPLFNQSLQMQPYREPDRIDRLVRGSNLSIQGFKTNLESRQNSPRSNQKEIRESFSVKVLIQSKASRQEIFGGEKFGRGTNEDSRNSAMTQDNPDDVMNRDSDHEELDEHKFQVISPKLNQPLKMVASNKNLSQKKTSKRIINRKRKSALNATNGGVEPWDNREEPVKQQQSMLSLSQLEQDFDTGPVIKDQDSVEFLLEKDNSVVKLDRQADINSSFDQSQAQQRALSSEMLNKIDSQDTQNSK